MLDVIEAESGPDPRASILILHGLGADGNDFVPIAQELDLEELGPVRFVFPHAPEMPVTINGGYVMPAWYDLYDADFGSRADLNGMRMSQEHLEHLVARERSRGVAASRIVVGGFSQGGAVALYMGVRHRERLAGIVALSAYLVDPQSLAQEAAAANKATPVFMAHGTEDEVVRYAWGDSSRQLLAAAGWPVEWHAYRMPHSAVLEELRDLGAFLARVLSN